MAYSQYNLVSGGNGASGGGGNMSFTVGQLFFYTWTGSNGSASEGGQQAPEGRALDINLAIFLEASVYPNPSWNTVVLKISTIPLDDLKFDLYDLLGRRIKSQRIESPETNISMDEFVASMYFLKVIRKNQVVKVFKIIKYK